MIPTYRTTADLPAMLPVFPLAGCILLPRTMLPLQVFEPRYLAMVDDCLRGDRLIGIIQPVGDGGTTGSPPGRGTALRNVGCAGRIRSYQELDDGRLAIGLGGIARFRPQGEATPDQQPYRTFAVNFADFAFDLEAGDGEASIDREGLLDVLKRFLAHRGLKGDWDAIQRSGSEQLVNGLSLASPFNSEERQALLEAPRLNDRAKLLAALAEMEIASGETGGNQRMQ
ncbi:MAG: LON peptidase substrate-binding domain-containing protein [Hyphomicrobiaceae bacterium]